MRIELDKGTHWKLSHADSKGLKEDTLPCVTHTFFDSLMAAEQRMILHICHPSLLTG